MLHPNRAQALGVAALVISGLSLRGQTAPLVIAGGDSVDGGALKAVGHMVRRCLRGLAPRFADLRVQAFTVVVHANASSLPEPVRRGLDDGVAGLALLERQQIHLILDRIKLQPPDDLETVLTHEVVHILLHQFAGEAGLFVPRWFHEGLAQALSGGTYLGASEEDIVLLARTGNLLRFSDLQTAFPRNPRALRVAYAQSFSFVSFLLGEFGLAALLDVAAACRADRSFPRAFSEVTDRALIYQEKNWVDYVGEASGAAYRLLLGSCFSLSLVVALPLLVLAGARRWNRDYAVQERLNRAEQESNEVVDDK